MLKNYFKIAWRSFYRNLTLSAINIVGLSVGLAATLLIVLYVAHEYSFDRFHSKGARIALAELNHFEESESYKISTMSYGFGEAVKSSSAGIEDFGRITEKGFGSKLVESDKDHIFFEPDFRFSDAGLVRMFSFRFLSGNPETALDSPNTVLLTESSAKKYFGDANPLGKTIIYDKKYVLQVVGVLVDLPANSSIQFDFLADLHTQRAIELDLYRSVMDSKTAKQWTDNIGTGGGYETYFLLKNITSVPEVEKLIPSLLTDSEKIRGAKDFYELAPLYDLHFSVYSPKGRQKVSIFAAVACLTLLLALINYVNLATARSSIRAKEVSIRKIVGAARKALIVQFYLESFIYVTLANGLAFLLFFVAQPFFYKTLHLNIERSFLTSPFFLGPTVAFWLVSVFLSGSYPALLLSGMAPIKNLKGRMGSLNMALNIRNSLTVIQFTVSLVLIVGVILFRQQLNFLLDKNLGIDRDRVLTLFLDPEDGLNRHYKAMKEDVSHIGGVEAVTASNLLIYDKYLNSWNIKRSGNSREVDVITYKVDPEFIKTMNVQWAVKPGEHSGFESGNGIVINEAAARQLGIDAKNYHQNLDIRGADPKELAGVVRDFHFTGLAQAIKPMALFIDNDTTSREYLYIKVAKGASVQKTIASIRQVYNRYKSVKPFEYTFLDETYRRLYASELEMGQIISAFTALAILIASLGLFGLATFAAEQRIKEIGIRKILGANVAGIVGMLSKDFLILVLIAVIISCPVAWYLMQNWLESFSYRINIEWWVFALAATIALFIALLTVSFQAIRAALMNPVKSLRSE